MAIESRPNSGPSPSLTNSNKGTSTAPSPRTKTAVSPVRVRRITRSRTANTCWAPRSSVAAAAFAKKPGAGPSTAWRAGSNPSGALNDAGFTLVPTANAAVNGSNGASDSLVNVWPVASVASDSARRWATPWSKATTGSIIRLLLAPDRPTGADASSGDGARQPAPAAEVEEGHT